MPGTPMKKPQLAKAVPHFAGRVEVMIPELAAFD